ncbi:phosphatase PAP2 family protein [Candidatus Micrarchaeota archaeon]|nr:phosphatase PAP2 family protein [Candidatus Micrarchaeota archaeon]
MIFDQAWLAFAVFLENYEYVAFGIIIIAALALLPRKRVFAVSAGVTLAASWALKLFFHQARPCLTQAALVACPPDFGFPSGHAALSGLLLIAGMGSPWTLLFAPLGLLIGYSRVFLGVHTPEQVLAGFALSLVIYLLIWRVSPWEKKGKNDGRKK